MCINIEILLLLLLYIFIDDAFLSKNIHVYVRKGA